MKKEKEREMDNIENYVVVWTKIFILDKLWFFFVLDLLTIYLRLRKNKIKMVIARTKLA